MPKINKMNMFGDLEDDKKDEIEYKSSISDSVLKGKYRPLRDQIFRRWMSDKVICQKFLEMICGKPVNIRNIESEKSLFSLSLDSKEVRLDIFAEDENFNIYNIESQNRYYDSHSDRCLYYFSRIFGSQLKKSDDFNLLKKTTVIFINKNNPQSDELLDEIELRYCKNPDKQYNDKLKIVELNLNNLIYVLDDIENSGYGKSLLLFSIFCLIGDTGQQFFDICDSRNLSSFDLLELGNLLIKSINKIKNDRSVDLNDDYVNDDYDNTEVDKMLSRQIWHEEGKVEGKIEILYELEYPPDAIAKKLNLSLELVKTVINNFEKEEQNRAKNK